MKDRYECLTKPAKEALHDFVNKYENRLIEEAYVSSTSDKYGNKEISLRDIFDAKDKLDNEGGTSIQKPDRKKNSSFILLLMGFYCLMFGIILYFFYNENSLYNIYNNPPLLLIVGGFLITYLSIFMKSIDEYPLKRLKEITSIKQDSLKEFVVLKLWNRIEELSRILMSINGYGYDTNNRNISMVIDYLNTIFPSSEDRTKLKKLLKARNMIAHDDGNFSEAEIKEMEAIGNYIIDTLEEKRIRETPLPVLDKIQLETTSEG